MYAKVRKKMSSETARRIATLPRDRSTNATHVDFDCVKTICEECEQPIVEFQPRGSKRELRKLCHRCAAAYFPSVRVRGQFNWETLRWE